MQLAQAEPVRVLDDHQGGVGNIHTHFDDGGSHHHIRFSPGKGCHGGLLLRALHLAMEQGDPQVREHRLLQGFRPDCGGLQAQLLVFLHGRTDHKALIPLRHVLADESIDPGTVALVYQEGIHRFPAGRQLVQNGHLQIAVHQQGQGPGDGSGGHHQQMGVRPLGGKL